MGERGDSSAILDPSQKCILEASFDLSRLNLKTSFEERDIDFNNHCTIRREWSPNGKTRSFINESQVTVSELKWLGQQLLEIHSQHTGLLVTQPNEQLKLLDAFCDCTELLADYQHTYYEHQKVALALKTALEQLSKITQDTEYNGFLRKELEDFNNANGGNLQEAFDDLFSNVTDQESYDAYEEALSKASPAVREYAQIICNIVNYDFNNIKFDTNQFVGSLSKKMINKSIKKALNAFIKIYKK